MTYIEYSKSENSLSFRFKFGIVIFKNEYVLKNKQ